MDRPFSNIMVITEGEKEDPLLLEPSIDIANRFRGNIHLVRFMNRMQYILGSPIDYHLAPSVFLNTGKRGLMFALNQVKKDWQPKVEGEIFLKVLENIDPKEFGEYVEEMGIDLVITRGYPGSFSWNFLRNYRVRKIIRSVNCPVLTIAPGYALNRIRSIIIPVGKYVPRRKAKMAYLFARIYAAKIFLVSGSNGSVPLEEEANQYGTLLETLKMINKWGGVQVDCMAVEEQDATQAALQYAKKIPAELIVVNPGVESKPHGLFNTLLNKQVFAAVQIPVLTVKPYPTQPVF